MTKSESHLANYAVKSSFQIAWFVSQDDAADFISTQPHPEDYTIVELD